jgi:hypothetical protein
VDYTYYLCDSKTSVPRGFCTLDQAREALLSWIRLQQHAGEPVVEQSTGQWSDSRVTCWIADGKGQILHLESA